MEKNKKYRNYSIKKKLLISHGIIIALATVIITVLLFGMGSIKGKLDGLYEGPLTNIEAIGDIRYALTDILRAMDRIMAETDVELTEAYSVMKKDVETDVEILLAASDKLEKNLITEESKEKLAEMLGKIDEGEKIRPQIMELLKDGDFEEVYDLNFKTYLPMVEEIKALADELESQIRTVASDYYTTARIVSFIFLIAGVAALAVGIIIAVMITARMTRAIVVPINEITEASELMHEGDMSAAKLITYESEDEIGIVAASLRGTMKNLQNYVEEISSNLKEIAKGDLTKDSDEITDFLGDFASIKESFVYILKRFNATLTDMQNSSNQVASSAKEIAGASWQLSEGATEQAGAIQELTATVATVAEMSEESAKNTQEAYDNIRLSADKAEQEKVKMEELTEEMKYIMDISREIENIITDIEDIASQTNLLSLNASIEAARAGDAGKGFAVVADQIGKLASDSAQSAVNTRELIRKTLEEIEKGYTITESTSVVFEKVIEDMKRFAAIAQDTNETAKNQATALEQIGQGIEQISLVMQTTASASEESTAISEDLSREAADLDKLVQHFKLY